MPYVTLVVVFAAMGKSKITLLPISHLLSSVLYRGSVWSKEYSVSVTNTLYILKKNPVPFSKFPDGINVNFISAGLGSKHRSDTPLAICPLWHRYSLSVAVAIENENED